MILHGAITTELGDESLACKRIDESIEVERAKVGGGYIVSPSDDEAQVRIRGKSCGAICVHQADVDAFAESVEEIQERVIRKSARVVLFDRAHGAGFYHLAVHSNRLMTQLP